MQTQNHYYARKLIAKEIPWDIAKQFTKQYHRDGMPKKVGGNKISYGLYDHDELLAVAMFCNPRTAAKLREYTSELLRLTFKTDVRIIGGASKLIKQYITDKNPWDLFTYQDTSGENTDVYLHAGMTERTKNVKPKQVIVKNGYTYEQAKQANQKGLWFSMIQVVSHGPDALIGSNIGEQYVNGKRVSNVKLFTMPEYGLDYHLEDIPGDRLFEWRNPNISFYIYKITSEVSDGYYIGRHVQHLSEKDLKQQYQQNPQIDAYMGSGGAKFQNWVKKVGQHTLRKEILKIVATHKQASYQEKKYIDLTDINCKNQKTGDAAQLVKNVVRQDGNIKKIAPLTRFKRVPSVDLVLPDCTKIIVRNLNRLAHAKNVADQKDDTKKHALSSKNKNVQNVVVYRVLTIKTVLMQKDQNVPNVEEQHKVIKKHVHNMYLEKNVQNAVVETSAPTRKHVHITFRTKVFVMSVAHQNQHINEDVLNTSQSLYVKNVINVMVITQPIAQLATHSEHITYHKKYVIIKLLINERR